LQSDKVFIILGSALRDAKQFPEVNLDQGVTPEGQENRKSPISIVSEIQWRKWFGRAQSCSHVWNTPLDLRDSLIPASGFAPAIQSLAIPKVAFVSNQRIQIVRGIYKSRADLLFSDCIRDTDTVDQRRTTEDVNRRFPT
jgi:hypothetical protein